MNYAIFTEHDGKMPRLHYVDRRNLSRLVWYRRGLPFVYYEQDSPVLIRGRLRLSIHDGKPTHSRVWSYALNAYIDARNIEGFTDE